MSLDAPLSTFKAVADPTRLRLLSVLATGEATVGELQEILAQSQPRVSRHLRLLDEADLVTRFRDGQSIYYRLASSSTVNALVELIGDMAGDSSEPLDRDREALLRVKQGRQRDALADASQKVWGRSAAVPRPDGASLAAAIDEVLGDATIRDALAVGCGSGVLLTELGRHAGQVVGIDTVRRMRILARSRVHQAGLANCTVRDADMHALPFPDDAFDLVLLDETLSISRDPRQALQETARVLRAGGWLLIFDQIQPAARQLSGHLQRDCLFDNQLIAMLKSAGFRVSARTWFPGRALEYALFSATARAAPRSGRKISP